MITGKQVAEKALTLARVNKNVFGTIKSIIPQGIPYVDGGETTSGLDCQGFLEWCHRQAGFKMSYAGTNDMIRNMTSCFITIEECVKRFGSVPIGAPVFILEHDGNEPAKYKADGIGNASHVYIKVANGFLMHASSSKKGLVVKEFKDKTIPNGGPNYVGLVDGVSYDGVDYELTAPAVPAAEQMGPKTTAFSTKYAKYRWRKGDTGNGVRAVQTALNLAGADPQLAVDGEFGILTAHAVVAFQHANGLVDDGVVGEYTWEKLIDAANAA